MTAVGSYPPSETKEGAGVDEPMSLPHGEDSIAYGTVVAAGAGRHQYVDERTYGQYSQLETEYKAGI